MSKIDLDPITSGYNLSKINSNFQKVENELNNRVLYRDSPAGETNSMSSNLDMNGRSVLNANKISSNVLELGGVQVVPTSLAIDPYNGTREALRRSYAEAGYNLVDGSFAAGFTLVNINDVALDETTGKAFSGATGTYPPGTATSGFSDKSYVVVMHFPSLASIASSGINFSLGSKIVTAGYYSIGDGGGGSYIVTVPSATSVDVGSYSFELVDGFDIRKFGIVDDRELVLDQQAKLSCLFSLFFYLFSL